jgi:hypothetical protein
MTDSGKSAVREDKMRPTTGGLAGAALGIAAVVLAGCGTLSTPTGRATATGQGSTAAATGTGPGSVAAGQHGNAGGWAVRGTFEMVGGTSNSQSPRPLAGVVMFRAASGRTTAITTGPAGQFAATLPAGTYTVTARTGQIRQQNPDGSISEPACAGPVTVVVRPEQTTQVALVCAVP